MSVVLDGHSYVNSTKCVAGLLMSLQFVDPYPYYAYLLKMPLHLHVTNVYTFIVEFPCYQNRDEVNAGTNCQYLNPTTYYIHG
jgi:hypothetical protein